MPRKNTVTALVKDGVSNILKGLRYDRPLSQTVADSPQVNNREYIFRLMVFMELVEENATKAKNDRATELLVADFINQKKKEK